MRKDTKREKNKDCVQKILIFCVGIYRSFLSGIFGGACRFQPSCSCYAEQALRELPLRTALWLIAKRLLKCHPFGPFGYDPVPQVKNLSAQSRRTS